VTLKRFADEHKLSISQDDCGDDVIRGKHGHLYVDAGVVCAIWTNATPMKPSSLATLGGLFWQGNISPDAKGRRVQDAWVKGIRPEAFEQAIRLVGAKRRRVLSPAQRAVLESESMASRRFRSTHGQDGPYPA
jgi:hypothetical protein